MSQPRNRVRGAGQTALAEMLVTPDTSEADFQKAVIAEAVAHGWTIMHVLRGKVGGFNGRPVQWITNTSIHSPERGRMNRGWPDLTLMHPTGRLLFLELKGPRGTTSPEQKVIMALLQKVAATSHGRVKAFVVGPDEWPAVLRLLHGPSAAAPVSTMVGTTDPGEHHE